MKLSTHELSEIKFIDFHTHHDTAPAKTLSIISLELADFKNLPPDKLKGKFFSVGLHPWQLPANTTNLDKDLKAFMPV